MKRAFQLPLTKAILSAQPSQRQVDRLAAPLRRRGAWSQFIDARLNAPGEREASRTRDPEPMPPVAGQGLPPGPLVRDTHPELSLKQRLQRIIRQCQQGERRQAATSQPAKPDPGEAPPIFSVPAGTSYFDHAFELNDVPAAFRAGDAQSSPSKQPRISPAPRSDRAIRPVRNANPLPAATGPFATSAPQTVTSPRQPRVQTGTSGSNVAAKARRAMILELIPEHPDRPTTPSVAHEEKPRSLAPVIASGVILAALAAGLYSRDHLAPLPGATAQLVSGWKDALVQSLPSLPRATFARATPVQSAPVEIVGSIAPAKALPDAYGIFASSDGRLIRLEPTNLRLPDSRIAMPGLITKPASVVVPHGRLSFVAFQRELMTSAPDSAQLRVVARVARALSFSPAGKPTVNALADTWAIRAISIDLSVAPVAESREMVTLRPLNPDFVLSPGRYMLVFKNQTYDFVVAGTVTDKAHCLEKAETQDGEAFTECRKLP